MHTQVTMVAWNAAGILKRRSELSAFGAEYDADIIFLSETYLAPNLPFSLPAYACYRQDSLSPPRRTFGGGTAILYRRISNRLLPPPTTSLTEACAVALYVYGSTKRVILAYLPPRRKLVTTFYQHL